MQLSPLNIYGSWKFQYFFLVPVRVQLRLQICVVLFPIQFVCLFNRLFRWNTKCQWSWPISPNKLPKLKENIWRYFCLLRSEVALVYKIPEADPATMFALSSLTKLMNQSIDRSIDQSIDQSIKQSINQLINQSTLRLLRAVKDVL